VPWPHYDDYVARDLVARVDSAYRTVPDRAHRGIAGLSMGGYGAVSLALRYPDVWSAAVSHSGVLAPLLASPKPYAAPPRWAAAPDSLRARYGGIWATLPRAFGRDTMGWWARDPGRLAARLQRDRPALVPALFVDTGTEDTYVDQNRAFRDVLTSLGVAHHYAEWPGAHGWSYWRTHAPESLAWLAQRLGGVSPSANGESY
jgi:S-formylglutathione hydrolase FrmB